METIIPEIAGEVTKNIAEIFAEGKSFVETEKAVVSAIQEAATSIMSAYVENIDAALTADKSGRKEAGYTVERRNDERRLQTMFGLVSYKRTLFKRVSGGYEYLADRAMGIDRRIRVSEGLSLSLANAAKDMSYQKASNHISGGEISRQTVMNRVRQSMAADPAHCEKKCVSELHIDADEAHVTLCFGKKSEVPLISVYEGIERHGRRNKCKNIFHISEYGKKPDELWEQALSEIERRYNLTDTKLYLHGDGGGWIQKGLEWMPGAMFVLDKYHKNKAIKTMTAGLSEADRKLCDREIRLALENADLRFFDELTASICNELPGRSENIRESAGYLKRFVSGISICKTDPRANNGGCTEPHVSHVLAARLSSRPMAWSKKTLKRLAPVLAAGNVSSFKNAVPDALPVPLRNAAVSANKAFRRGTVGLPSPAAIGILPVSGKITGTHKILKLFL